MSLQRTSRPRGTLAGLVLIVGMILPSAPSAQPTAGPPPGGRGAISGSVVDAQSGHPVEFANVVIYSARDSSLVTGAITDAEGVFRIEDLSFGRFYAEAKFIGYHASTSDAFAVTPRQLEVRLPTLRLTPAAENLEAVVVTGQQQMLTHNLDRRVFNVSQDINSEGGTALDVMRNIPAVEVDIEGNVRLRGNANITILVDGRPSHLNSLDELPASMIESVEVVTNPSARFDPDGVSGIINIVLKRQRTPGYHGMVTLNAGTSSRYSGSANFNTRRDRFNLFGNVNLRQFRSVGQTMQDRTTTLDTLPSAYLEQDQDFRRRGRFGNLRLGADYFLDTHTTLTASGSANVRGFSTWDMTQTRSYLPHPTLADHFFRENQGSNRFSTYEVAVNFRRNRPDLGQELHADVFFSQFAGDFTSHMGQWWDPLAPQVLSALHERANTASSIRTLTVQADLVQPIGTAGRLEAGAKGIVRTNDNDYTFQARDTVSAPWMSDPLRSNHFIYDEQLYSLYGIYSQPLGPVSLQGGVRVEQALTVGHQLANSQRTPLNFLNLFPTAHARWHMNEQHSLQLAYSRRVNRPNIRSLNPFVDYSDPLNISMGNPQLLPELSDSYELSYALETEATNITATAFYRQTDNVISRFVTVREDGVAVSTFRNLNRSLSYGLEGILTQVLTPWWRVNLNASLFRAEVLAEDIPAHARQGRSWSLRGTSSWRVGRNLDIQLNGTYRSPEVTVGGSGHRFWQSGGGQGRTQEMYWIDLGARLQVLNRRGTITLRVSDVLNTQQFSSQTFGQNFTSNLSRTHLSRTVHIGFSYRINEFRQREERNHQGMEMDMD